eukprot:1142272-Rhodomonas_salina.3
MKEDGEGDTNVKKLTELPPPDHSSGPRCEQLELPACTVLSRNDDVQHCHGIGLRPDGSKPKK